MVRERIKHKLGTFRKRRKLEKTASGIYFRYFSLPLLALHQFECYMPYNVIIVSRSLCQAPKAAWIENKSRQTCHRAHPCGGFADNAQPEDIVTGVSELGKHLKRYNTTQNEVLGSVRVVFIQNPMPLFARNLLTRLHRMDTSFSLQCLQKAGKTLDEACKWSKRGLGKLL